MKREVGHKAVITYTLDREEATRFIFEGAEHSAQGPVGPMIENQIAGIGDEVVITREYDYTPPAEITGGMAIIVAERLSHAGNGYTDDHDDDEHADGELAIEASQLAVDTTSEQGAFPDLDDSGFGLVRKHRGNRIKQLAVAASLLAAEIDRLIRSGVKP